MTENKGMDNSPIKIAQWVGSKAQDGKMRWIMITNLPVADLHSQRREMLLPKPLNTYLLVFLFAHWFSIPSRKVWTGKGKEKLEVWRECSLGIRLIYILFKAISNKIFQVFKTLKWLRAPHQLFIKSCIFCFSYKTIALHWREKPTSLINENKEIDNSPIKIAQWVGSKAQDGKMRWVMITKTIMGVIFNLQNSHSSISSLPTEEIFLVNGHISRWQISQISAARNAVIKATEYVTFGFSFPFRKVWTSLSVSDTDFSVLAAIIRENSHKLPCIENGEGSAVHSLNLTEWRQRRETCQQLTGETKHHWVVFQLVLNHTKKFRNNMK